MDETKQKETTEQEFKPKDHSLVVLTLNNEGSHGFTYVEKGQEGQKEIYYIDKVRIGSISQEIMLLGQFLSEFENSPSDALLLEPGCTNRIYFPNDMKIMENGYNYPNENETAEFVTRMNDLSRRKPQYSIIIRKIIDSLGLPANKVY